MAPLRTHGTKHLPKLRPVHDSQHVAVGGFGRKETSKLLRVALGLAEEGVEAEVQGCVAVLKVRKSNIDEVKVGLLLGSTHGLKMKGGRRARRVARPQTAVSQHVR